MAITQGLAGAGGGGTGGAVTQSGTWTVGLSAGANTVGKVDQGVGGASAWKVDGTGGSFPVAGSKTNNNAAPGATNVGTLSAIANAAAPTWVEGNQVGLSADLAGNLRVLLAKVPGTISSVNSTTVTLTSGSVFTGTAEDISGYAALVVNVFADQAGTFSPQFSSDGANWDFQGSHAIAAGVGQMFVFRPGTKFFRAVYTNGGTNQGAFRFQTVYHLDDVNFATAQTLGAGMANPTTDMIGASLLVQPTGGTTWSPAAADSSARQIVVGAAASGSAISSNPHVIAGQFSGNVKIWAMNTSGQGTVAGALAHNNGAPGIDLLETMPALANAAAPTYGEGNAVLLSTNLAGALRVTAPVQLPSALISNRLDVNLGAAPAMVTVQGGAAAGAAVAGNPVIGAVTDGANAQAFKQANLSGGDQGVTGVPVVAVAWRNSSSTSLLLPLTASADSLASSATAGASQLNFNGGTSDRNRNNVDATLLASAARTTTQGPTTLTTYNLGSIVFVLDMTSVGTGSVTLTISEVDPASGKSILLLSGAAVTTNSTNVYTIDPMLTAAANSIAKNRVTRTLTWQVTANNANPATYSLGAMELMP